MITQTVVDKDDTLYLVSEVEGSEGYIIAQVNPTGRGAYQKLKTTAAIAKAVFEVSVGESAVDADGYYYSKKEDRIVAIRIVKKGWIPSAVITKHASSASLAVLTKLQEIVQKHLNDALQNEAPKNMSAYG